MNVNYKMLVAMLQEQLIYTQDDLDTTMADLETEERMQKALEDEVGILIAAKLEMMNKIANLEYQNLQLNIDFFDLGDMLMEALNANGEKQPAQKLEDVVTGALEFMDKQYQTRIEYLEELIFELGDEVNKKNMKEIEKRIGEEE
ncbi:hypothetical protein [Acetobacterium malicum]|uniref:hypothetical protein n=1 Tax=Acetobacterium malicum TaxID=52692 RepID=UPI0035946F7A